VITFHAARGLGDFVERVGAFLQADEVVHNLLLGILGDLAEPGGPPGAFAGEPVLAWVEREGAVAAVAVMVPPRNLVVSKTATAGALDALALGLARRQRALPGVNGPAAEAHAFASAWRSHTGRVARRVRSLQLCEARTLRPPVTPPPGSLRLASAGDADRVTGWITAFNREALSEEAVDVVLARRVADDLLAGGRRSLALWEDGGPVSMAATGGRTESGARVFAVYTPPPLRRRGYASAVVAAATRQVLDAGRRYCCLFFDTANPTAGHIYQAMGYVPVASFDEFRFD
jgi:predicted GNAT family acetyltransferase